MSIQGRPETSRGNGGSKRQLCHHGQSLLEYAVLVAAVTSALLVMSDSIRRAYNANAGDIENELAGK